MRFFFKHNQQDGEEYSDRLLGYADPVLTRDDVIGSDPERDAQAELLSLWHADFGTDVTSLSDIEAQPQTETHKALRTKDVWNSGTVRWRLGRILGRVEGGLKLVRVSGGRAGRFQIVVVTKVEVETSESDQGNSGNREKIPF